MTNVFLIGKAGAGKDTLAEILYARGYRTIALADPIKSLCSEYLGRPVTKADRALLIELGQAFRRWFGQYVWCDKAMETIYDRWTSDDIYRRNRKSAVITDGRHSAEYDYFVTQRGFVPVRITAPDEVRFARLLARDGVDQRDVLAGQETELDDAVVEYTIDNGGTLDELERQVVAMLEAMKAKEGTR